MLQHITEAQSFTCVLYNCSMWVFFRHIENVQVVIYFTPDIVNALCTMLGCENTLCAQLYAHTECTETSVYMNMLHNIWHKMD